MDGKLEGQTTPLDAIDKARLTPLVRGALDSQTVEVTDWSCEQLHGGSGVGNAVYRLAGQGRDRGQTIPWSFILKTASPEGDSVHVSAWNYYKREADAYRSGWLDDLPGGLVAPRCFGVVEYPDGRCWMCLEEARDDVGPCWPMEHYGIVARHAGQLNGAYLVDTPQPCWPWLSSGWLRHNVESSGPALALLRDSLDHPLIRRGWPGDAGDRFFRLWEERNLFLDALDHLPQTVCHLDLFRRNLFARKTADGDDQTVVIDWAFVGRAAIGEELVPLVWANVYFNEVDLSQAQALEGLVFEGYLEGLRDAGWRGDPRLVRLGYAVASLRYRFGELNRVLGLLLDESQHAYAERVFGCSMEALCDYGVQIDSAGDRLIDEARRLLDILD